MRFFFTAFIISLKRMLRNLPTLFCLLLLPILVLGLGLTLPKEAAPQLAVLGVYVPANSPLAQKLYSSLQQYNNAQFQFTLANTSAEVGTMVAAEKWDSGYIINDDFDKNIINGQYKGLFTQVSTHSSNSAELSKWPVTAALLEVCAKSIANEYLSTHDILQTLSSEELSRLANEHFGSDLLMTLKIETTNKIFTSDNKAASNFTTQTNALLVRGGTALLLMLFSLLCAARFSKDMKSGFFARMQVYMHPLLLFTPHYAASALLSAVAGGFSLGLASFFFHGFFFGFWQEFLCLILYLLYLSSFSYLLSVLFKNPNTIICILPFLLLACFILSPIIIDISQYIPSLRGISALLAPTLYLRASSGSSSALWQMLLYTIGTFSFSFIINFLRRTRNIFY